jgi:hypothetical protein
MSTMTRGRPKETLERKFTRSIRVEGKAYEKFSDLPADPCWLWVGCWSPKVPTVLTSRRFGGNFPIPYTKSPQPVLQHDGRFTAPVRHFTSGKRMCPTRQCQNPSHYNVNATSSVHTALAMLAKEFDLRDSTDEDLQAELPQFTVEEIHAARSNS